MVADFDVDRSATRLIARFAAVVGSEPPRPTAVDTGARGAVRRAGAMIRLTFWAALATIAYTYVGFPLLVLVRARLRPRPPAAAPIEPTVSIVLAARNEEAAIGARLDNLVALDYPADRLSTIVASDGSDDRTVEIARRYADRGVQVLDRASAQ